MRCSAKHAKLRMLRALHNRRNPRTRIRLRTGSSCRRRQSARCREIAEAEAMQAGMAGCGCASSRHRCRNAQKQAGTRGLELPRPDVPRERACTCARVAPAANLPAAVGTALRDSTPRRSRLLAPARALCSSSRFGDLCTSLTLLVTVQTTRVSNTDTRRDVLTAVAATRSGASPVAHQPVAAAVVRRKWHCLSHGVYTCAADMHDPQQHPRLSHVRRPCLVCLAQPRYDGGLSNGVALAPGSRSRGHESVRALPLRRVRTAQCPRAIDMAE